MGSKKGFEELRYLEELFEGLPVAQHPGRIGTWDRGTEEEREPLV